MGGGGGGEEAHEPQEINHNHCCRLEAAASPPAVSVQQLKVSSSPVVCLTFSPTGRLLAACSDDKVLKVWQSDSWEIVGER